MGSIIKNKYEFGARQSFADLTLSFFSLSRVVVKAVFSNRPDPTRCFHAMKKKSNGTIMGSLSSM